MRGRVGGRVGRKDEREGGEEGRKYQCDISEVTWMKCSLVPRPRPAFRRLQYGKVY